MGLFDKAAEMFGNANLPTMDPKTRLLQAALSMLTNNGQTGGLSGLVERFQGAGMGDAISSWIGTGQNVPITGAQVQQALGEGQLQQISEEAGLPQDEAANSLSEMLPNLVDKLTPSGHIPQEGLGDVGALLGRFLGKNQ